jgi:hypothetical protein
MYCPQCGTESTSELKYCRSCGANLKVISKAVTLSDAIARSDGFPAKIKELFSNVKIAHVTEDVSRALDKLNTEISRGAQGRPRREPWWLADRREKQTPERRRERQIVKGTISLFWGTGLTIFLYYLSSALILKLPPDVVARIPFEIDPVVHVIWLLGLIPTLAGLGRIIAGLSIRPGPAKPIELADPSRPAVQPEPIARKPYPELLNLATPPDAPRSITERTTNILEHKIPTRQTRVGGE